MHLLSPFSLNLPFYEHKKTSLVRQENDLFYFFSSTIAINFGFVCELEVFQSAAHDYFGLRDTALEIAYKCQII